MTAPQPTPAKQRTFDDLTGDEKYNVGRVVGMFTESIRARRLDGRVSFMTHSGREMTIGELLAIAKRLSNTL